MRPRQTPTRLELHRIRYMKEGRRGELLTVHELDDLEKDLVQRELLQDLRARRLSFPEPLDEGQLDQIYLEKLSEWGIMCTHPIGSLTHIPGTVGLECNVCGCAVLIPEAANRAVAG